MDIVILCGIVFLVVILILVPSLRVLSKGRKARNNRDVKRAGIQGEHIAVDIIKSVLYESDIMLNNVAFEYGDNEVEIDSLVINSRGVYVIEVKNYSGDLYGKETDFELFQEKETSAGNVYSKSVKNPVPQVKRQVHNLAKFLKYYGIDVWVEGYVYFINNNCPYRSPMVLRNAYDINRAIHPRIHRQLSNKEIQRIVKLLK